jgi:hypothetical protein
MAITVISQPATIFPAYNPAPIVLKASNSEVDVTLRFWVDGSVVATHKREFFALAEPLTDNFGNPITDNDGMPIPIGGDSLAVFDLGKIARNYFSNALIEINTEDNEEGAEAYIDRRMCIPFEVEVDQIENISFCAVNAALPPGVAESAYSVNYDKFLTEFSTFKYYEGFSHKTKLSMLRGTVIPTAGTSIFAAGELHEEGGGGEPYMTMTFTDGLEERSIIILTGSSMGAVAWCSSVAETLTTNYGYEVVFDGFTPNLFTEAVLENVVFTFYEVPQGDFEITVSTQTEVQAKVAYCKKLPLGDFFVHFYASLTEAKKGEVVSVNVPERTTSPYRIYDYIVSYVGAEVKDVLPVEVIGEGCFPSSPFYVRWVNRIGGREHWMFSRRQTDKTEIDNSVTYDPYVDTNADLGRFPRQLSLTSEHKIVVGAEGISNADFDVLRRITTSPLIEYYDEETEKWMVVTLKNGTTSKDTALPTQAVEFEFTLPSPALQF